MHSHQYAQNTYSDFITKFKLQPVSCHSVNTECSFGASGSYRPFSRWKEVTLVQLGRLDRDTLWFLPSFLASQLKTMYTVFQQLWLL